MELALRDLERTPAERRGLYVGLHLRLARGVLIWALLGWLLVYLSWQAFDWLPLERSVAGDALLGALNLVAVYAAWRASRRASASPRTRRAWVWVTLALAGQAAGAVAQLAYDATATEPSYPSLSDPLYLSFYPLLLIGVLTFPAMRRSGRQALDLALDCAIVALGGGAAFVYFVLGPQALAGSTALEAGVTIAYPVGDMILLVALAAMAMGSPLPATRASLRWIAAAMALFVVGDFAFGYAVLHGGYEGGDLLDTLYGLAFICFIVAAARQRPVAERGEATAVSATSRATWLPYLGIAAALAILVAEEQGHAFFPGVAVTLIVVAVTALIAVRKALSLSSLQQGRERLAEAQGVAHVGSWDWDVERDQVEMSDEMARMLGIEATHPLSREQALRLVHPDDRAFVAEALEHSLAGGAPFAFEVRAIRPDGEVRTLQAHGVTEKRGNRIVRMHGTNQDVSDRRAMEARLRHQADHDPLTGLYNRRRFVAELDRALKPDRSVAILMLDVDNFKFVNDAHGHAVGDRLLVSVARLIEAGVRDQDVVARLGADEFAVLLPGAGVDRAVDAAERIRRAVSGAEMAEVSHLSAGVACFGGEREMVADEMLIAADVALYEAEEEGKDRVQVYTGGHGAALTWVERIRRALAERRFVLYAQPIADLESGLTVRRELLVRMLGEDDALIPPNAFLPTAERFGLSTEIDRWVVGKGLELARDGECVSVNLSAPSIGDGEILDAVRAAVDAGLRPGNVIFEITETAAMTDIDAARAFVIALAGLGCDVALDDFGTGFSSFTYLKHLPARYLKIDTDFVRDMLDNPTDREVVKSIAGVAHSLGKRTIAEGVEDDATLKALRSYGVDMAQGFAIGQPCPVVRWIEEGDGQRIEPSGGLGFDHGRADARDRALQR